MIVSGCSGGEVYEVKTIESHHPQKNDNSETHVIVWEKGSSGHVKKVFCAFSPDVKLTGSNDSGWTGIKKIRVGKQYEEYMFSKESYYCYVVE